MKDIKIRDLLDITKGYLIGEIDEDYREQLLDTEVKDIATDSRNVEAGTLFVAIQGEVHDGHKFIPAVAEKTKAILTEEDEKLILAKADVDVLPKNVAYIRVPSTEAALQQIGAAIRDRYDKHVVGVTGSVGKTTTREMITAALSTGLKTYHTKGNMNSQIGVPITTSAMLDEPSDIAVLEMGISMPGEMDRLVNIVKPDIAVVTIIGVAHMEFLGSREGIRNEKLKIADRLPDAGVLFLNADDPMLWELKGKLKKNVLYYGTNPEADYVATDIVIDDDYNSYTYNHGNDKIIVNMNVLGKHNVLNSLVAMAICDYLGLNLYDAASAFESFQGLRQKVIRTESGVTVVDDAYNASPDSMKAMLDILRYVKVSGKRYVVLGDMFELGNDSKKFHSEVGEYIATVTDENGNPLVDKVITIGGESRLISEACTNEGINAVHYENKDGVADDIFAMLRPGDMIMFKASNSMKFSALANELVERLNK